MHLVTPEGLVPAHVARGASHQQYRTADARCPGLRYVRHAKKTKGKRSGKPAGPDKLVKSADAEILQPLQLVLNDVARWP